MDDTDPPERFGREYVEEALRRRLEDAKKSYEQAINRLWAANTAGMFAVLGAFAAGKAQGLPIFAALSAFVLGLLALTVGSIFSLRSQTIAIRELEEVNSLLDLKIESIRRPSDDAGLTIYNVQTIMGFLSGALFFLGASFGMYFAISHYV
jgi:hypothetical protein